MIKGNIFDIKHYAVHDGPGIRTTVFFKGCPLSCQWCHNPESQSSAVETVERQVVWGDGTSFSEKEVIGRQISVCDLMKTLEKDRMFFDQSGGGVTFSGGEPLSQPEFLLDLLKRCKKQGIHTAIDTSGYGSSEIFEKIANLADIFLYDLKIINDDKHQEYMGVSNKLILKNLSILSNSNANIQVRLPVIQGITDTAENITAIIELMQKTKGLNKISLLPYHTIADGKYKKLKKESKLAKMPSMKPEDLIDLKERFELNGIITTIGG